MRSLSLLLYLIDNDIIIELASYKLLGETMASFNLTYKDKAVRILPSASSYINSDPKLREKYKQETLQSAKNRADSYEKINLSLIDQKEDSEYESLIAIENIDPGEALLVAATEYEPDFYILTSDKKFLKALSKSNLVNIKNRLYKKIICLEQLIIHLINHNDFDKVRRRIASSELSNCDIAEAFKNSRLTQKELALQTLEQRVKKLRDETGDLLIDSLPPPPIEIKTPDP